MTTREKIWIILSDLFIDTELTPAELNAIGLALRDTGESCERIEQILREEVAPVCGQWMLYPTVGPWPKFDEVDLIGKITKYISRPWYRFPILKLGLFGLRQVREDWSHVKRAMNDRVY